MKILKSILVRMTFAKKSLQAINEPKIGDIVYYGNERCMLTQGVSKPYWKLLPLDNENMKLDKRKVYRVHENQYKLQPLWRRFKFSFSSRYRWFMTNWYEIEVRSEKNTFSYMLNYLLRSKAKL